MVHATADGSAGDRLRVGMVGGGRNAFIGAVHRFAMRLDDRIALVAGALSADPENAFASAEDLGIARERAYSDWRAMARAEGTRPDGIEAVVIVTPNHLHAPVATAFLEAGHRRDLRQAACDDRGGGRGAGGARRGAGAAAPGDAQQHRLRHGAAGAGDGGGRRTRHARLGACELPPGLADAADRRRGAQAGGMADRPGAGGESAVLADIGVHAFNLACFVSGLAAEEVAADLFTAVPGRRLDDNAHVLVRWSGGPRGTIVASQTSPGHDNDLTVRVFGDKGGLEWSAVRPEELRFTRYGEAARTLIRGGPGSGAEAARVSRMPAAHPEGYIEAFANLYRDAAAIIAAHRRGEAVDPGLEALVPDVRDGLGGVRFVAAAVGSNRAGGAWTRAGG